MSVMKFCGAIVLFEVVLSFGNMAAPLLGQEKGVADFPKLAANTDWPWWRGPSRNGLARNAKLPTRFGDREKVLWKTPVPGRGHSSPIVVANRIFLTTADESKQIQSVVAFDAASGKQLWKQDISQGGFPEHNHAKNTAATPTIASDGERLFVTFFHHKAIELVTLTLDGKVNWRESVGPFDPKRFEYGYAPSPLIYRGSVIVAAEHDGDSYIVARDRASGKQMWRTARPSSISFSSPVVGHVAGRDQLLISGIDQVCSYDPATGKQLWVTPGTTLATCGTMVWEGDIVVASGGFPKAETIAIRADGSRKVLWKNNQKCYEQSLLISSGHVYALTDNGVFFCWRISDGKEMWKQRLQGPVSASPIMAGDNIYWANEAGTVYVVKADPAKFQLVSENQVGTESFASPAVSGDRLYLRVATNESGQRQEYLYSFGP